ncbi:MAG: hypothetical protein E3J52_11115 [Promethearchaeota archaeon]|nr:MAG: hypothetical protein E3J52_11115 [Candidatus Lokiarchaeota archaeon]
MKKLSNIKRCNTCGRFLSADDFSKGSYRCRKCNRNYSMLWRESNYVFSNNTAGRPKGYVVSEKTKAKISKTRTGSFQDWSTKDKISKSLLCYFREKNSLSDEMSYIYKKCCGWIEKHKEEIDKFDDVKTLSRLSSISHMEIAASDYIEKIAIDDLDPEKLLLIKEELLMYL